MMSAAIGERIRLAFRVQPDQQPPTASGDSGVYRYRRSDETMVG